MLQESQIAWERFLWQGISREMRIRWSRCYYRLTSVQEFAVIKKIDIKKMSEEDQKATYREAKILEVLNHPYIIRFKEVYKTKAGQLCIVMDYADGK